MGSGATKAVGNPWYEARMVAARMDSRLSSREGAAELLGMSVSAVADAELGLHKAMPADKAVLMADLYNAPSLLNWYCLHECPIGKGRPISDETVELERAVVRLTRSLRKEAVQYFKHGLQDIAADGRITKDEFDRLDRIVEGLRDVARIISELEVIRDKVRKESIWEKKR